MAAKKKAAAPAEEPETKTEKKVLDHRLVAGAEIDAESAQREADQAALIVQRAKVKPDAEGDIDQRMAALEADHKRMGAR